MKTFTVVEIFREKHIYGDTKFYLASEAHERDRVLVEKWKALDNALRERDKQVIVLVEALEELSKAVEVLNSIRPDNFTAKIKQWPIVFVAQDKANAVLAQAKKGGA